MVKKRHYSCVERGCLIIAILFDTELVMCHLHIRCVATALPKLIMTFAHVHRTPVD
jgi:hypothetical protein